MSLDELVTSVGAQLGRAAKDVAPYTQTLEENWYDSAEALAAASIEDLTALGLPRRFAVELLAAATGGSTAGGAAVRGGGKSKGKGKSKGRDDGEYADEDRGRSGKGKGKKGGKGKARGECEKRIPVEFDVDESIVCFTAKFIGAKGSNIHHIQDHTGTKVQVTGQQSDGWLEVVITGDDEESVGKASDLAEDLIESIFDEVEGLKSSKGKGKGKKGDGKAAKGKGKGKDKGKTKPRRAEYQLRIPIDTSELDPEFHLRAKLVGIDGQNVKHIESATHCYLTVEHDDGEGMAFLLEADDESALEQGREMCDDLLNTVLQEAGAGTTSSATSAGKGKNRARQSKKGSGKGQFKSKKGADSWGDERPAKFHRSSW